MIVTLIIIAVLIIVLAVVLALAKARLMEKAEQSRICYEALLSEAGIESSIPTNFCVNTQRIPQIIGGCFKNNPLPKYKIVLLFIRLRAAFRLFGREKVVQTPAIISAMSACSSIASKIGQLRNYPGSEKAVTNCDVALGGMQALRLYFVYSKDPEFSKSRFDSCFRVNNAFNGSFYKYKTKDNRHFSFHVYYENQKEKMIKAMGLTKTADEFCMATRAQDIKYLSGIVSELNSEQLEDLAFSSGASGCVLRSRDEWDKTGVGKAVNEMPLIRTEKTADTPVKTFAKPSGDRGPLSGVKVLDLTHIIAGPACSRILAEYGADVLLVRRGEFIKQEQAFLELDGWAGKKSIQLDFNIEEELERVKELIKEADVVVNSYQTGALDHFGLSEKDIHKLNPSVIYGTLMCFSDSVWQNMPGWAPLAEDISGLSIRNGSLEKPKNLNGVPLDYIPGLVLGVGVFEAIRRSMVEGGGYTVTVSLSRTAVWLHECTDLLETVEAFDSESTVTSGRDFKKWNSVIQMIDDNAIGTVGFPSQAVMNPLLSDDLENLFCTDGNKGWGQK